MRPTRHTATSRSTNYAIVMYEHPLWQKIIIVGYNAAENDFAALIIKKLRSN